MTLRTRMKAYSIIHDASDDFNRDRNLNCLNIEFCFQQKTLKSCN